MESYQRLGGATAYAVAAGGVAYSVAFVAGLKGGSRAALTASFVLLLVGGLLSTVVVVAMYQRLRDADAGLALLGMLLATVGVLGSAIHGGYNLALVLHPPADPTSLPNAIDPRGLLTFGVAGLGLLVLSRLIRGSGVLPRGLGSLGTALGILMILTYLGRLVILDPNNPALLGTAAVTGLAAHPWFFVWLGRSLRRAAGTGGTANVS